MSSRDDANHTPCGDAPSFVLGALESQQARRFLEHADGCAVCRDELSALAPAVDLLAESAPQVVAPKQLKHRVMDTVRAEATARQPARRRALPFFSARSAHGRPAGLIALCGALVVVVVALAVSTLGQKSSVRNLNASVTAAGAVATLHQSAGHTWLTVAHMPQPGSGRVYEVWIARGSGQPQATSALFTPTSSGEGVVAVPGSVSNGSEVLVTSEPAGGSLRPTRAPVIVAHVS
jgi:hypothetical protein